MDLQLLFLCREALRVNDEGGARVPTSDQQSKCVRGRSNSTAKQQQKKHPQLEKGCVERKEAQGKRVASQDAKKGARAAIGKKRVDGQKCSRVSLLLGRASSSNRTNGWQS